MSNWIKNTFDLILFVGSVKLGINMQPIIYWLGHGSLPPWTVQLSACLPGAIVALYHLLTIKRKDKNGN
jgi:hypothetical protein